VKKLVKNVHYFHAFLTKNVGEKLIMFSPLFRFEGEIETSQKVLEIFQVFHLLFQ
jgi:hypothetical protein